MQPQTRNDGAIAQLVEQRTENPCVPGSIPGGTTEKKAKQRKILIFNENRDFLFPLKIQKSAVTTAFGGQKGEASTHHHRTYA